jgi:response regulator RpfG family c-di-GMP phosphodiesterase
MLTMGGGHREQAELGMGSAGQETAAPTLPPKILVIEDQGDVQSLVKAMLTIRGFTCDTAGSLQDARERMHAVHYDIMLVDVNLPDGSGLSLVPEGQADGPMVVVMTGSSDIQTAIQAIRRGAVDFITKPFTVGHFLQRVDNAMEAWRGRRRLQYYAHRLETLVQAKSDELSRTSRQIDEVCDMTVLALGAALNLKDHETADHCDRVSQNSVRLGSMLSLPAYELKTLKWSAYLHDVGKIGIPEQILLKPGALTPEERRVMEKHPLMGFTMIRNIEFLKGATDVVLAHHERWDGSGYPYGLTGSRIPLHARIFSVIDAMDAMSSDRPYSGAQTFTAVRAELERKAGTQFDPDIVRIFLGMPQATWLAAASLEN